MKLILETERMLLREFEMEDYKEVFDFGSNPEVGKYTGDEPLRSYEEAKAIIDNAFKTDYNMYGYGRWAPVYKPNNRVIGFAGLKYLKIIDETDIGFRFLPEYWGKGIATEISAAIIKYGFNELNLSRIIGIAHPQNIGSCKVLSKIGMEKYKVDEYEGDGGKYNWYSINK